MTGLNIQWPWAELLIRGWKSVETRSYPLPKKYIGEKLALVETPGKSGSFKSRIIGEITFSHSFKYPDEQSWKNDYARHGVSSSHNMYSWDNKPKYGWVVSNITKYNEPITVKKKKGIIFTGDVI
jgi:hypothetical protein